MQLSELQVGQKAQIVGVRGQGAFRKRILEMGFVEGKIVEVLGRAPLGDPTRYRIMDYEVSLRRDEALLVDVTPVASSTREQQPPRQELSDSPIQATEPPSEDDFPPSADTATHLDTTPHKGKTTPRKVIRVVLVGNPNSGKTSVFNLASGAREHTGNYSGVTVDSKTAHVQRGDYLFELTDLPGTYSLSAYSPEELYVRNFIAEFQPDVIVNVVDATNLERNLYLTLQLLEQTPRVVVALNMWDEFTTAKHHLNRPLLSELLGAPCVPTVGRTGQGLDRLLSTVVEVYEGRWTTQKNLVEAYGSTVQSSVSQLQSTLRQAYPLIDELHSSYFALRLLENDADAQRKLSLQPDSAQVENSIKVLSQEVENATGKDFETYATDARYSYLGRVLQRTFVHAPQQANTSWWDRIDRIVTHRVWGIPIFLGVMWFMFWVTFTVGEYPKGWMEDGVAALASWVNGAMPPSPLTDLLTDGVINGVGAVIVFLPQILILFLFIALLEDSGYMARAVFVMDRAMRGIGLHGRSFIPMVMGFGCNVPSIMATRTIGDRKVRMVTMLVNPFMQCSARLQVYVLLAGFALPSHPVVMLLGLYLFGIIAAVGMALLFRKTLFRGNDSPFVMEIPPYRLPTARSVLIHMWDKGSQYLRKMGTVILVAAILIWVLGYFPRSTSRDAEFETTQAAVEALLAQKGNNPSTEGQNGMGTEYRTTPTNNPLNDSALTAEQNGSSSTTPPADSPDDGTLATSASHYDSLSPQELDSVKTALEYEWEEVRKQNSFLGRVGKFIEPGIYPLGFDWRIGIGLLSGIAAKEVVVSTLGVLIDAGNDPEGNEALLTERIERATYDNGERIGEKLFTPLTTLSLLLFVALYVPCIAVIAAIKRESGSWRWALFSALYTTGLAYIVSLVVYQIGRLL